MSRRPYPDRSFSQRERREARLQALNQYMQRARDAYTQELARGVVVVWRNNFSRLQRFCVRMPAAVENDVGMQDLLMGSTIEDCAAYLEAAETAPYGSPPELKELLRPLTERLTIQILTCASAYGYQGEDIEKAIICLAREDGLDEIIDYLGSMISLLESPL